MNKIVIDQKIHVYQDVFDDISEIFSFIKETESYQEKTGLFRPWGPWAGTWKGSSTEVLNQTVAVNDKDDEVVVKQKEFINKIRDAFLKTSNDYINDYIRDPEWPPSIKEWENFEEEPWSDDENIDFLKYNKVQNEEDLDMELAMKYHTDYNNYDKESPGRKKAFTVTVYVNDEYENGEISVYSPITKKVYNYKPKAGDIVVFPSGMDYYHGVLPFSGSDRYLIRMFKSYSYTGSEKWLKDKDFYGEDMWLQMEKERLYKIWLDGKNLVSLRFSDKTRIDPRLKVIEVNEDPIYIDGTKND
jgi:hypothetical protein